MSYRLSSYVASSLLLFSVASCTMHYPDSTSAMPNMAYNASAKLPQISRGSVVQRPVYAPVIADAQPAIDMVEIKKAPVISKEKIENKSIEDKVSSKQKDITYDQVYDMAHKRVNISEYNSTLFRASEQGNVALVLRMIGQGANVSSANTSGETALHSAATRNQLAVAKVLIENGADVNARTVSGWSPLHSAARFGADDVIALLVESGAVLGQRNKDGKTASDLARQAGQESAVSLLRN